MGRVGVCGVMAGPVVRLRGLVRRGPSDAPGRVVDALGRIGLVGYGAVHLVVAWLALEVAFGVPAAQPDASGAVGTIAQGPGGQLALGLAALGLVAFAVWQLAAAAVGFRWVDGGERFRKRVGAIAKAIAMSALAVVVVGYLAGVRSGERATAQVLAAEVLALPAGRILLAVAAAAILALAGAMTYTGVRRTFMGDLDVERVGEATRQVIELVGVAGHLSRALAVGVVGMLTGTAAIAANPARAGGLDAALRALGGTGFGSGLLVVVAVGFASFGLFCVADAAIRRA